MNKQKQLWEKLAKENPKYYVNTDFGRGITDDQFNRSGQESYKELIVNDGLVWTRDSILDFGCGIGRITEHMAKDFKKVVGVDISPTMITGAKKRLKGFQNVTFFETDKAYIPLPENSIDFVFAYLVFQHFKEREMVEKSFREIHRVLKLGGVFKVLLRSDKQPDMSKWWSGVEYDPEEINKVYIKVGFKLLKIKRVDQHAYWLWLQKVNSPHQKKWEHGKNKTLKFYKKKLPWKAQQFNRKLPLHNYFGPLIGNKQKVTIAELGSGMFCTIGSFWPTAKVKVFPSDILANEFSQILKEGGVTPLIPVAKEDMQHLTYPDNYFDIVHCVNALDHTVNPLQALREMYRVCKSGGFIYLRHFINIGEKEKYVGLHTWNISLDNKGDCVIWNQDTRFLLSECFPGFKSTKKTELDYETEDMVVSILHKT